jgi:UDP-N-acetylmuramyl pentapeptide phosphotransferase/UDP-N-acetylglucosamine-1-phosphate transferase
MSAQIILTLIIFNIIIFFYFNKIKKKIKIYDYPDKIRKFHKKSTSMLGGAIIFSSLTIIFIYEYFFNNNDLAQLGFYKRNILLFFIFSLIIFSTYLFDDIKGIKPNFKLLLLSIFITLYLILDNSLILSNLKIKFLGKIFFLHSFSIFFTLLCFLLFINAFNMFDGINLQCGSYSLLIFIIFLFFIKNIFFLYFIIPLIFFLILNYSDKCFLGNSGSALLAFIISVLCIKLHNINKFYADDIFLLMCIPGYELLRLAFVRLLEKKHPFYPDRNHIHHLISDIYGDKIAFLVIFILILIINFINLFFESSSILAMLLSIVLYTGILFYIKKIKL